MRRLLVSMLVLVTLGVGVGAAWAYLTSTGSGAGIASTSSLTAVTLDAVTATPTTPLLPGRSGDATFEISNSNSVALTLVSVTSSGLISVTGGSGCTSLNDGVSFVDQSSLSVTIPANVSNYVVDLPSSVTMSTGSATGCQGATFSIPIVATVHQG